MKKVLFLNIKRLFVVVLFLSCQIEAVDGGADLATDSLSIQGALTLALRAHPLIDSARDQFDAAKSDLSLSRWSRFPSIGVSSMDSSTDTNQETASASMPLWLGGRLNAEVALASTRKDGAFVAIAESQQTVMLETIAVFFEFYRSEQQLLIANDNVDEHQRLYEIIQRRAVASTSPDVDTMLALARLQYARSSQIQALSRRDISRSSLELLVNNSVVAVRLEPNAGSLDLGVEEAVSLALAVSPRIERLGYEIEGLGASVKSARSVLFPQVSLGYEKRYGDLLFGQEREEVFVSVDFQPGAGLSAFSSISAAKARKRAAISTLKAEKRDLRRQIKTAWNEYTSASSQLEPSKRLVTATTSVVDSYLRQYAVGKKSWLDVLNAQREATQAKNTLVDFEVSRWTSLYRLRVLLNEINAVILGV
jgi:adhesin transport system outer membrane protein